jgi:ABC-2 type transport system ATP-binding protein
MHKPSEAILSVQSLSKIFERRITAVDNLDLTVPKGELFAFLGPNGAGKTTTLNMICGLCIPSAGTVEIGGATLKGNRGAYLAKLGLVSQNFNIDVDLSAQENMIVHAYLHRLKGSETRKKITALMHFAGLYEERNRIVRSFSGGMKRKLQIVRALLHDPEIIFMDEPTAGLDAHSREKIWDLIKNLAGSGKTVFFSTHYIEEAESYADRVGIIHKGKLIRLDGPKELIDNLGTWCREEFTDGKTVRTYYRQKEDARSDSDTNYKKLTIRRTHLEDVFIRTTGEEEFT